MTWLGKEEVLDDGGGILHGRWFGSASGIHGIYPQDGTRLLLCFCERPSRRPTSFFADNGQHLLILHRVKPGK